MCIENPDRGILVLFIRKLISLLTVNQKCSMDTSVNKNDYQFHISIEKEQQTLTKTQSAPTYNLIVLGGDWLTQRSPNKRDKG